MERHLLALDEPPLGAKELEALELEALQALHSVHVQPKRFSLDREYPYEVYVMEAVRLGRTVQDYWYFQSYSDELWDGLHGAPVTIDFNSMFDSSNDDYSHLF